MFASVSMHVFSQGVGNPAGRETAPRAGGGGVVAQIKKRMALMKEQLDASRKEIRMNQEQFDLDLAELQEENARLKKEAKRAKSSAAKADQAARAAERELKRRMNSCVIHHCIETNVAHCS
eukprot:m.545803 g.545803  ORF g.545803 m.545803 type:complete len:121 (+) comp22147_c0_seq46:142-504(+)